MSTKTETDVNGLTLDGWSPLQIAVKAKAHPIVPDLIRLGARWSSYDETRELPPYQVLSTMEMGAWPLDAQVESLALLLRDLILKVTTSSTT